MSKFDAVSFAVRFPFTAEAIAPECLGGSNGHFLKRVNGGESAAVMAAYDANERGDLLLANHPELLAECKAVLPDYGWQSSVLVVAYLTGRLGRLDKDGLCRTGSTTVFSCGQKAINLKDKLFQSLVYGGVAGQSARNEGEIFVHKYDAMTGKRKRATPADAADVAASSQASAEEKALATAIMADDRIPAFFDDTGKLVYGLPSPDMLDAPIVEQLGKDHAKLKEDQDALASAISTCKSVLNRKSKVSEAKRKQQREQLEILEKELSKVALELTRIENNPLFKKVG